MDFYQWYVTNPQLIVAFWHGCLGFHVYYENTLFSLETYLTYGWDYKNTLFSVDLFDVWPTLWKYFQYNMGNYGLQTWQRLGPTLAKALEPRPQNGFLVCQNFKEHHFSADWLKYQSLQDTVLGKGELCTPKVIFQ